LDDEIKLFWWKFLHAKENWKIAGAKNMCYCRNVRDGSDKNFGVYVCTCVKEKFFNLILDFFEGLDFVVE